MKRLFAASLCMMLVLAGCDSAAELPDDTTAAESAKAKASAKAITKSNTINQKPS